MKINIRKSVFETNSSSCHSLVISKDGLEESQFKLDENGALHCSPDSFGTDEGFGFFNTQYEKLSYILTHCLNGYTNTPNSIDNISDMNWDFDGLKVIENTLKNYTGCNKLIIDRPDKACLNHQLCGDLYELVNEYDEDSLINFIFNKNIGFEIYHD